MLGLIIAMGNGPAYAIFGWMVGFPLVALVGCKIHEFRRRKK